MTPASHLLRPGQAQKTCPEGIGHQLEKMIAKGWGTGLGIRQGSRQQRVTRCQESTFAARCLPLLGSLVPS